MKRSRKPSIFAYCYSVYAATYIARVNLSIASPELISSGLLNVATLGTLGSIFSTVYALGRLFNGQLSDKARPALMLGVGLTLVGTSNILLSSLPSFSLFSVLWGVNALGQSMLWGSLLVFISRTYDMETAKKKAAVLGTTVAVGNILGIILNGQFINLLGVSFAFLLPGVIVLEFCAIIVINTLDIKAQGPTTNREHKPMLVLFRDKSLRRELLPAVVQGAVKDNITLWIAVYMVEIFSVDIKGVAGYVLFVPVLGFLARSAFPLCYKFCGNDEDKLSYYAFLLCALFSIPLCLKGRALMSVFCLSVLYALASMVNSSITSIFPNNYSHSNNVASVSGIMDFSAYIGSAIFTALYGLVIKAFGYKPMFVSWIILSLLSAWSLRTASKSAKRA